MCMESNDLEKSMNISDVLRFFARTPSIIGRIVKICDLVERFLRKSF